MVKRYSITGMTCSACSLGIERTCSRLKGVKKVEVSLMGKSMKIDYDETVLCEEDILSSVRGLGYGIFEGNIPEGDKKSSRERELFVRFIVSLLILIPLMYVAMGHMIAEKVGGNFPLGYLDPSAYPQWFCLYQLILSFAIIVINRQYFSSGAKALLRRVPNMDTLVSMGSGISFVYSFVITILVFIGVYIGKDSFAALHMDIYFESSAMILALVDIGKWLEEKSKAKTGNELEKLKRLAPDKVTIEKDGVQRDAYTKDICVGDVVIVRPGEYIPVDGEIISGSSFVDKSAITGESLPVEVTEGDDVTSASLNKSGLIKIMAKKVGDETTLSKIIDMVQEAGASKAPIQKLADKIAGIFVPLVFLLAVITFFVWLLIDGKFVSSHCVTYAICVLVISCPCALGLATPVAVMTCAGKAASCGILYKDAESMQKLCDINCVLLDKTATITEGKPKVNDVLTYGYDKDRALFIACGIEKNSTHPLARCIVEYAGVGAPVEDFEYFVGMGAKAVFENKTYILGNEKLVGDIPSKIRGDAKRLSNHGNTVLYLAENNRIIAIFSVADEVKSTSLEAVNLLKTRGMRIAMLTGDGQATAKAVADKVGIEEYVAEVMPEDKLKAVQNVQAVGGVVSMVGDGINDSPALKESDVGIAIGSGTDVAIDSAGVVLLSDDLRVLDTVFDLSKATMRNIKENLFWAFFYNVIMIPVAAGVFSHWFSFDPIICALCMCISSLFVCCNALRLKGYKNKRLQKQQMESCDILCNINEDEDIETYKDKLTVHVTGMMCEHCQKRVRDAIFSVKGVEDVSVSFESGIAKVYGKDIQEKDIKQAVKDAGYKVKKIER